MRSVRFPQAFGLFCATLTIQDVMSEEECRDGFTPKRCCSYNSVQENNQLKCNLMIPESNYSIYAEDTMYLNCDPGFAGGVSGCSWRLPSGEICNFLNTDLIPTPQVCSADSSIKLVGNLSLGICNIELSNVQTKHEGSWNCSVTAIRKYFDSTYLEINNGLKTSTILAITIPVSLLVLAIAVILICCFCPALFASCACLTACCHKKDMPERRLSTDSDVKPMHQSQEIPPTGPSLPPRPPTMIQPIIRIQRNKSPLDETHYDTPSSVSSYENMSTVGANCSTSNPADENEPVLYTTLNPQGDESGSMQTARKVSNAISVHSFGPRKNSKFRDVHF
ncbi:uncharacterized protein LOC131885480 isoform X2 [Tigriopus californicus]|uniref:uncharacterized protein LOC131885480 isoform X2 n=1 Tax=Tigriopus californicus TaxID=6832 RepID=UPI0027DA2A72|nr:uncharacterized protein LOC131885480 isoform X2 [Tigriopus californicus]